MSRTIRGRGRFNIRDGDLQSITKDKKPRKRFVFRGDGWATKARGGIGNKAGWGGFPSNWRCLPKWLYKKYKEKQLND